MSVKDELIRAVEGLGYIQGETFMLQGTFAPDKEYPESFLTYWIDGTTTDAHYDDDVHSTAWSVSLIFYSASPVKVNTEPDRIRKHLKESGFIPIGKGQDVPSDEPTHTGWAMSYLFKDYE